MNIKILTTYLTIILFLIPFLMVKGMELKDLINEINSAQEVHECYEVLVSEKHYLSGRNKEPEVSRIVELIDCNDKKVFLYKGKVMYMDEYSHILIDSAEQEITRKTPANLQLSNSFSPEFITEQINKVQEYKIEKEGNSYILFIKDEYSEDGGVKLEVDKNFLPAKLVLKLNASQYAMQYGFYQALSEDELVEIEYSFSYQPAKIGQPLSSNIENILNGNIPAGYQLFDF